jgi:hypothetical protein
MYVDYQFQKSQTFCKMNPKWSKTRVKSLKHTKIWKRTLCVSDQCNVKRRERCSHISINQGRSPPRRTDDSARCRVRTRRQGVGHGRGSYAALATDAAARRRAQRRLRGVEHGGAAWNRAQTRLRGVGHGCRIGRGGAAERTYAVSPRRARNRRRGGGHWRSGAVESMVASIHGVLLLLQINPHMGVSCHINLLNPINVCHVSMKRRLLASVTVSFISK